MFNSILPPHRGLCVGWHVTGGLRPRLFATVPFGDLWGTPICHNGTPPNLGGELLLVSEVSLIGSSPKLGEGDRSLLRWRSVR